MRRFSSSQLLLSTLLLSSVSCLASAIEVNGTWYNFWNASGDGEATNGSSCSASSCPGDPYSAPGDPPWTFTITGYGADLVITDGGNQGDIFSAYNNGILIGTTSSVTVNYSDNCGNTPTPCLNDPGMSHGTFYLTPGSYSLTITEDQFFEPSYLAWFQVDPLTSPLPTSGDAPEPASFALAGLGLLLTGVLRRTRLKKT